MIAIDNTQERRKTPLTCFSYGVDEILPVVCGMNLFAKTQSSQADEALSKYESYNGVREHINALKRGFLK